MVKHVNRVAWCREGEGGGNNMLRTDPLSEEQPGQEKLIVHALYMGENKNKRIAYRATFRGQLFQRAHQVIIHYDIRRLAPLDSHERPNIALLRWFGAITVRIRRLFQGTYNLLCNRTVHGVSGGTYI